MNKGIQLAITKNSLKNQYINGYIRLDTHYKTRLLQKEFIKFKKKEQIFLKRKSHLNTFSVHKYFLKKNLLFNKRKFFFFKQHGYFKKFNPHWLSSPKLQSSLIFPFFNFKSKDPYRNYTFRKQLYFNRVLKSFYAPLHPKTPNIESRLEVLLVRSHWALSITQARYFIRHQLISSPSITLKPGDIISAHPSLYPTIFKNLLLHSKIGSKIPSYIQSSPHHITLISSPSLSNILYPTTLNKSFFSQ